jgi:hypothetical protein
MQTANFLPFVSDFDVGAFGDGMGDLEPWLNDESDEGQEAWTPWAVPWTTFDAPYPEEGQQKN